MNTVRFDRHYAGLGGRLRQRLPIEASWRGEAMGLVTLNALGRGGGRNA